MGRKFLTINVEEVINYNDDEKNSDIRPIIHKEDCPNVFFKHHITAVELDIAFDTIITYFMQNRSYRSEIDLEERDKEYRNRTSKKSVTSKTKSKIDENKICIGINAAGICLWIRTMVGIPIHTGFWIGLLGISVCSVFITFHVYKILKFLEEGRK